MSFDDEDSLISAAPATMATVDGLDEVPTAEEALEEEAQDFRLFSSLSQKKGVSSQLIRKGEKDFETHGTQAQESALEQSRQAMEEVLSYNRVYRPSNWLRGWYFPDWFADWPEDGEDPPGTPGGKGATAVAAIDRTGSQMDKRRGLNARDRVVVVEGDAGIVSKSIGRVVIGQTKDRAAREKMWLLPEEALFLVERGSLDLWWPGRSIEAIFPADIEKKSTKKPGQPLVSGGIPSDDEYDLGLPLSLEAAYSLLVGEEGERGKVTLQKFQVYSNLKRGGYKVQRAPVLRHQGASSPTGENHFPIWLRLFSFLFSRGTPSTPYGPLVRPGLYRSYKSIYQQLGVIPSHKPSPDRTSAWAPEEPFRIHFHVWKSSTAFSKTRPPPPDFYLSVVDAKTSSLPTLEQAAALLDMSPWTPPKAEWTGPGRIYPRLKHGFRNVILAVVDHGVVNYLRLAEAAFGEESLLHRFDQTTRPRSGSKRGGKSGSRPRRGVNGNIGRR
ncbi:hypothetical protein VTK73DRAFT_7314 [Phialemonium thermophilum]|uniref:tRNA-splicing endonuclease subunit Sen54 N-terminal domain-containing protein n=1 Tax=Phialemonium thermophilum TaxID=223376 RepID=A0ABR3XTP5_9PEZI